MREYGEPWYMSDVGGRMGIRLADGRLLTERAGSGHDGIVFMERAMVCVNACAGVPTERLREMADFAVHLNPSFGLPKTPLAHPAEPPTIEE